MNAASAWIIGRGGLLGSHVARALASEWPQVTEWRTALAGIAWDAPDQAQAQLHAAVATFGAHVRQSDTPWIILWCAGAGVIGTSAHRLSQESAFLRTLLDALARALPDHPGTLMLASSAGGICAGTREQPVTESSPCLPLSDYGHEKLHQEDLVRGFRASRPRVRALIARFSTLYGPGQDLSKSQGVISQLCRSLLVARPAHIFVPLDTLRDYLYAEDGARHLVRCLARLAHDPPGPPVVKIFAAEKTTSLAQIVGSLGRIAKRRPRIIVASRPLTAQHAHALVYRSQVLREVSRPPATSLSVGIQRVYDDLLARLRTGQLAPSPPSN